ncbi:MAG: hypothetical protein D3916_14330 [Candidatus Electrothrix sp. MAN1_4]|nr:hypothetical protein [Candidatus Electrothrix sp. MAN1_4]
MFHPLAKCRLTHFDAVFNLRPFPVVSFCSIVDPFPKRMYKGTILFLDEHSYEETCYKGEKEVHSSTGNTSNSVFAKAFADVLFR